MDFARIHDDWHARVLAYAAKLIGRDDAEDLTNEVFVKIARSLGTLSGEEHLASWIYAITANSVRDHLRSRMRRMENTPDVAVEPIVRTPEEEAMRTEMIMCYLDYVKRLPPSYHEVYVLSEFEHLPNAEIARRLSMSLATAKITLHRARAKVNDALREHCRCYYNEHGELMGEPK